MSYNILIEEISNVTSVILSRIEFDGHLNSSQHKSCQTYLISIKCIHQFQSFLSTLRQ